MDTMGGIRPALHGKQIIEILLPCQTILASDAAFAQKDGVAFCSAGSDGMTFPAAIAATADKVAAIRILVAACTIGRCFYQRRCRVVDVLGNSEDVAFGEALLAMATGWRNG